MDGERFILREEGAVNRPVLATLQHFYRTSSLPCPYLTERIERKVITELGGFGASITYNELSRAGFRRSHHLAYRPACPGCSACVPVRVDAAAFLETRSLRRIRRLNADLDAIEAEPRATTEQYRLFSRYQRLRHAESDMAAMTFGDYRAMMEDSPVETFSLELRGRDGVFRGACLVDRLDDGLSAVYSFYDPELGHRSLGTFLILKLVDWAAEHGLRYVYLGYWIASSRKMAYKTRFRPLESLGPHGWQQLAL